MSQLLSPQAGIVHEYLPRLTAFEFDGNSESGPAPNVVLFIGGLSDGLLTVPYLPRLAKSIGSINSEHGEWGLIQTLISSSYDGWGTGSLERDAKELSLLVKYLRSERGGYRKNIVLMGHLTGCQDAMQYLTKLCKNSDISEDILLDGAILQAPVSDREAVVQYMGGVNNLEPLLNICQNEYISKGKSQHVLPQKFSFFNTPMTAYRFNSLSSVRGDDDYFSSDLNSDDLKHSFGAVDRPLLVLFGSKDESVADFVDRESLVELWKNASNSKYWSPLSKVLKGASHNVGPTSDEGAVEDLLETVSKFILSI